MKPLLSVVSPCYNEEATLRWSIAQLSSKLAQLKSEQKIHQNSYICLVDDGSIDNTWKLISELSQNHPIVAIKLGVNVGHQKAITAGLHYVTNKCDCSITIDIDLQDDLAAMDTMLEHYSAGYDMVFGVRMNYSRERVYEKILGAIYYKLRSIFGIHTIINHADYRLLSKRAMSIFSNMKERFIYLRGIFTSLPLPYKIVKYQVKKRQFGTIKYTMRQRFALAWDGISSYSIVPLRFITVVGLVIFILSISYSMYAVWVKFFHEDTVPGWASTVIPIYILGGIILFSLGIVGEYIGKIYMEIKQRPLYFIEKITNEQHVQNKD